MSQNDTIAETFEHNGFKVEIHYDKEPENPREMGSNLITLACWHPRYNLGDKQIQRMTEEELKEEVGEEILTILPLYLYDHSGITMNTTGFSCGWDSGQVGWAYVTKESAQYAGCVVEDWTEERFKDAIRAEVEEYAHYISVSAYGYKVFNADGDEVEACWSFLGGSESAKEAAKEIIDSWKGRMK